MRKLKDKVDRKNSDNSTQLRAAFEIAMKVLWWSMMAGFAYVVRVLLDILQ